MTRVRKLASVIKLALGDPSKEEILKQVMKPTKTPKIKITNEPPKSKYPVKEYTIGERLLNLITNTAHNLKYFEKAFPDIYQTIQQVEALDEKIKDANKSFKEFLAIFAQKHPRSEVSKQYRKLEELREQYQVLVNSLRRDVQNLINMMQQYNVKAAVVREKVATAQGVTEEIKKYMLELASIPTGKIKQKNFEEWFDNLVNELKLILGDDFKKVEHLFDKEQTLLQIMGRNISVVVERTEVALDTFQQELEQAKQELEQETNEVTASIKVAFNWANIKTFFENAYNAIKDFLKSIFEKGKELLGIVEREDEALDSLIDGLRQIRDKLAQMYNSIS